MLHNITLKCYKVQQFNNKQALNICGQLQVSETKMVHHWSAWCMISHHWPKSVTDISELLFRRVTRETRKQNINGHFVTYTFFFSAEMNIYSKYCTPRTLLLWKVGFNKPHHLPAWSVSVWELGWDTVGRP